jgi:putative ABC transport system permease protein
MEQEFRDELAESSGGWAQFVLWIRLLTDLAITVPAQLARELRQDARHTFHLWRVRPWQTLFAILALAIGIGANTGVFSVVSALLLQPLPFRDSERLASFQLFFPPHGSPRQFHEWRKQAAFLDDASLWQVSDANFGGAGQWQRARVAQTSWNFFALMGVQPVLGRTFVPGEEVEGNGWGPPGANAVAVISYGLWQSLFAGDRGVLGATIRIDGKQLTIIGVAPPAFDYPRKATIWKPAVYSEGNYGFTTIGRLKQGLTWEQSQTIFRADIERASEGQRRAENREPPVMAPLRDELAGPTKRASLVLMAGAILILLIACMNVANLLTASTVDRRAELSIRSALGASRARLVQQLLTECVLLAFAAGLAGVVVAFGITSLAARLQPAALVSQTYSVWNIRVAFFVIAISLGAGLLFGTLPALYLRRAHTFGTRSTNEIRGSHRVRGLLVTAQVMLTIILVAASISVGRAFLDLMRLDRGFNRTGVVTAMVSLEGTNRGTDAKRLAYFQEVLAELRRLPGVRAASTTQFLPLDAKGFVGGRFRLDGRPASRNSMFVPVMQDYFRTIGAQLLAGREFTEADVHSDQKIAIVSESFAREFGQPADLIGRELSIGRSASRIVGVVKGMDYMAEGANNSQVFQPSRAPGWPRSAIVVRVEGRPEEHLAKIRHAILSIDPRVPLFDVKTFEQRMADEFARPEFYKTAVLFFATFALLLAILGIYSVASYSVARSTHAMGVRIALGARPSDLRASLIRAGFIPIVPGLILGAAGAAVFANLLGYLVEGAKAVTGATCAVEILVIAVVAAVAIWVASRPIARLDVMEILRTE